MFFIGIREFFLSLTKRFRNICGWGCWIQPPTHLIHILEVKGQIYAHPRFNCVYIFHVHLRGHDEGEVHHWEVGEHLHVHGRVVVVFFVVFWLLGIAFSFTFIISLCFLAWFVVWFGVIWLTWWLALAWSAFGLLLFFLFFFCVFSHII